jgi:leucyl aminopeptidase
MSRTSDALIPASDTARPLRIVTAGTVLEGRAAAWAGASDFQGRPGQLLLVPDADGSVEAALVGAGERFDPMSLRGVAARLLLVPGARHG